MKPLTVEFEYATGLRRTRLTAATLVGNWDSSGRTASGPWSEHPMRRGVSEDGDVAFFAEVTFDESGIDTDFAWGVVVEHDHGRTMWGLAAEVANPGSTVQVREFTLGAATGSTQRECYGLTHHRTRGARAIGFERKRIGFRVWAPNAQSVDVVFATPSGYIADNGKGAHPDLAELPMQRDLDGVWSVVADDFASYVARAYMYRVICDDGQVVYRTDPYSLKQVGSGDFDPEGQPFDAEVTELDGSVSCTLVVDQEDDAFWADEINTLRPVTRRIRDLVIYELHVGGLDPPTAVAGTFDDAIALLPYLEQLGVNAIALLPMLEFRATLSWGSGATHLLAIENSAGGRGALMRFVKACHQRGIAVLMDIAYNHYSGGAQRSFWKYDSAADERNLYYSYQGREWRYQDVSGGYVDNNSSGWAPRYEEKQLRELFVSSAAMLVDDLHLDGLRVVSTTSIWMYNTLHADGSPIPVANIYGRKLLREICHTLKIIAPECMLIAEDYSGSDAVTRSASEGGVGFDAVCNSDFHHRLIRDGASRPGYGLLHTAAIDHEGPLAMGALAASLEQTVQPGIVYVESHNEAGNSMGSSRTIVLAVDGAPLLGATRVLAEARCRFVAGMTLLCASCPIVFMGTEVGAQKMYTYDHFAESKEDLVALRDHTGHALFHFYSELIRLRTSTPALRASRLQVVHAEDANRVIAFRRWDESTEFLVVASLNEQHFNRPGYQLNHESLGDGLWRERFNSNEPAYGGDGVGNGFAERQSAGGTLEVVIPATGFVILERI